MQEVIQELEKELLLHLVLLYLNLKKTKKKKKPTKPSRGGAKKTTKESSKRTIRAGKYPLTHINLRDGLQKDAFADLFMNITAGPVGQSGTSACHSYIVSMRCPKLDKALKDRYGNKKKKTKKKTLDLKGCDIASVNRVFDYLYHDELPYLHKLKPLSLLYFAIAAKAYNLERLIWIIENQVLDILCLDNVVPLLKGANDLKDDRVRKFCMDFLLLPETFKEFVLRKDLTTDLGMELFSELVTLNATAAAGGKIIDTKGKKGGHAIADLGDCPTAKIRDDFKELYNTMLYADAFVRLDNQTIKFHKAILAAASKPLYDALSKAKLTAGQLDDVSDTLEFTKDQRFYEKLSAEAFKSLLKFVYYGDTGVEALPACLLIPFVREYGMKDLQELCEKVIQASVTDSNVALKIMAVTYLAIMRSREDMRDKLRKECIGHIVTHLKEIDFLEIKNMEKDFSLDLAVDLLMSCQTTYSK